MNIIGYAAAIIVMITIGYDYALDKEILGNPYEKALYAITCFSAWIKLFYLMGIFKQFAYFVTIIYEIIKELFVFMIMLAILMMAFSNFFYVIDDD